MTKPKIRDVVKATAEVVDVPYQMLVGPRRHTRMVKARHIAMLMARRLTDGSLYQIGCALGGRDHTTVLHGMRKAQAFLTPEQQEAIAARVNAMASKEPPPPQMVADERFIAAKLDRYFEDRAYGVVTLANGQTAFLPRLAIVQSRAYGLNQGDRIFVSVRPGKHGLQVDQVSIYPVRDV